MNRMINKIILVSFITASFILPQSASAQDKTLPDVKATQQLSYEVSKLFKEGNYSEAFDKMDPYLPLPEEEKQNLRSQTIKYKTVLEERFGQRTGFSRATDKRIGEVAIRECYLVQYELHAIRLIFVYFKSPSGWILNSFKWDDSFAEEFE